MKIELWHKYHTKWIYLLITYRFAVGGYKTKSIPIWKIGYINHGVIMKDGKIVVDKGYNKRLI